MLELEKKTITWDFGTVLVNIKTSGQFWLVHVVWDSLVNKIILRQSWLI